MGEEDDRWGRRGEVFIPPVTQKTVRVMQTPEPPGLSPEPPRSAAQIWILLCWLFVDGIIWWLEDVLCTWFYPKPPLVSPFIVRLVLTQIQNRKQSKLALWALASHSIELGVSSFIYLQPLESSMSSYAICSWYHLVRCCNHLCLISSSKHTLSMWLEPLQHIWVQLHGFKSLPLIIWSSTQYDSS